jgi:hypothetical protein
MGHVGDQQKNTAMSMKLDLVSGTKYMTDPSGWAEKKNF